jgi:hypothetical protein
MMIPFVDLRLFGFGRLLSLGSRLFLRFIFLQVVPVLKYLGERLHFLFRGVGTGFGFRLLSGLLSLSIFVSAAGTRKRQPENEQERGGSFHDQKRLPTAFGSRRFVTG